MRRRRINLTKESLNKWFVKIRKYIKMVRKQIKTTVNNEFD